jgi:Zn-dependent protease
MDTANAIFYIAILIMSVVIHEISHGFVAEYFGDPTARNAGRLTLNPLRHLDLFGSIILPILMFFSTGFVFGWAKPVPYNPYNLSNRKWGTIAVSAAGILANLFVAVVFGLFIRFTLDMDLPAPFYVITSSIVITNIALALFNLVPIPPLDGSKILFSLLPASMYSFVSILEQYSFLILLVFVFYFSEFLYPLLIFLYNHLTGIAF